MQEHGGTIPSIAIVLTMWSTLLAQEEVLGTGYTAKDAAMKIVTTRLREQDFAAGMVIVSNVAVIEGVGFLSTLKSFAAGMQGQSMEPLRVAWKVEFMILP